MSGIASIIQRNRFRVLLYEPKSDCIYQFLIDLIQSKLCLVANMSENDQTSIFLCVPGGRNVAQYEYRAFVCLNISNARSFNKQRIFFEILLNQPEVSMYLPFSDWFGTKPTSVWIQINRNTVNTISGECDIASGYLRSMRRLWDIMSTQKQKKIELKKKKIPPTGAGPHNFLDWGP